MEAQELGKLAAILSIFVDSELEILGKGFVELLEVIGVFRDLAEEVHAFLNDVLPNDLKDLVLLEGLSRNVEGEILGIDDA